MNMRHYTPHTDDEASSPAHTSRWSGLLGCATSFDRVSNLCSDPPWNVFTTLQLQPSWLSMIEVIVAATPFVSSHSWNKSSSDQKYETRVSFI